MGELAGEGNELKNDFIHFTNRSSRSVSKSNYICLLRLRDFIFYLCFFVFSTEFTYFFYNQKKLLIKHNIHNSESITAVRNGMVLTKRLAIGMKMQSQI